MDLFCLNDYNFFFLIVKFWVFFFFKIELLLGVFLLEIDVVVFVGFEMEKFNLVDLVVFLVLVDLLLGEELFCEYLVEVRREKNKKKKYF